MAEAPKKKRRKRTARPKQPSEARYVACPKNGFIHVARPRALRVLKGEKHYHVRCSSQRCLLRAFLGAIGSKGTGRGEWGDRDGYTASEAEAMGFRLDDVADDD